MMEAFKETRERAPRPRQTLGPFNLHSPPTRPLAAHTDGPGGWAFGYPSPAPSRARVAVIPFFRA